MIGNNKILKMCGGMLLLVHLFWLLRVCRM